MRLLAKYSDRNGMPFKNFNLMRLTLALGVGLVAPTASAFVIESGNPDVAMRFDSTIKYSTAFRVEDRSPTLLTDRNQDDGDRNFKRGLISNRLDMLLEFDLSYKDAFGLRLSGAGWYDDVYNRSNDNNSPATNNNTSVAYDQFNRNTRDVHGNKAELLDAFVFANGKLGDTPANLRVGQYTLLYGESMFFGSNAIAGAQAPQDIVKLQSVPNSQFKEIIRPVPQISGQVQLTDRLAVGAYYQFKWEKNRIPSSGSYFATTEALEGGELFYTATTNFRQPDLTPSDSGQGGVQMRWRPENTDLELGFYAVQFHSKTPQVYLKPAERWFRMVFPDQDVRAYGLSASGQIGDVAVGAEASVRRNAPLVSDPVVVAAAANPDNKDNAAYAIGSTGHFQASASYIVPPTAFWHTALFLGEIAWNRRIGIDKNANAVAVNSDRDAWATRMVFIPTWYQVATQLDLSMPIGLGFSPEGRSSAVAQFNPGGNHGGDISIGLQAVYQQAWRIGLNYTHYFGTEGTGLQAGKFSYKQPLADRDYISLSVQRSF